MKMHNGESASRMVPKAADNEYLYRFAECYELIGRAPPTSWPRATEYRHEYKFVLNLATDTTRSGRGHLHQTISVGDIAKSSLDLVVLDLGAGEMAEIGGIPLNLQPKTLGRLGTYLSWRNQKSTRTLPW